MNRMVLTSRVGNDGFLHLDVPLGMEAANQEVQITVEAVARKAMTQEEWQANVLKTAGSIPDPTFERPPQPPLEKREPLP